MAATYVSSIGASSISGGGSIETGAATATGSNKLAVVTVSVFENPPSTFTAVKWGGSGGTDMGSPVLSITYQGGSILWRLARYKLVNPADGQTAYASFSGAPVSAHITADTFSDVDQTTPIDNSSITSTSNESPTVNPSLAITPTSVGQMISSAAALLSDGMTISAGTQGTKTNSIYQFLGTAYSTSVASPTTHSWTAGSGSAGSFQWGSIGFALNDAGAGGGAAAQNYLSLLGVGA